MYMLQGDKKINNYCEGKEEMEKLHETVFFLK